MSYKQDKLLWEFNKPDIQSGELTTSLWFSRVSEIAIFSIQVVLLEKWLITWQSDWLSILFESAQLKPHGKWQAAEDICVYVKTSLIKLNLHNGILLIIEWCNQIHKIKKK